MRRSILTALVTPFILLAGEVIFWLNCAGL